MNTITEEALAKMKAGAHEGTRWAAYENKALDSATLGDLRFLKVGKDCTFKEPPARYPDTVHGTGWRHVFVGYVDLEKGIIDDRTHG